MLQQTRCPSADEWIKKLWYINTMEYYSAIKKNSFESVLMRWMKLEPITQSEVSQKDKHQYSILTHIYGILKDGNDNPICKTEKETQMYRTDFWTLWEKARMRCSERTALKQVHYQGWNRSPAQVGCMRQMLRAGALGRPRGMGWGGRREGGSGWGTHVNPWLIHVNVWQKPLQYCKLISLPLIKINRIQKKKKWGNTCFSTRLPRQLVLSITPGGMKGSLERWDLQKIWMKRARIFMDFRCQNFTII